MNRQKVTFTRRFFIYFYILLPCVNSLLLIESFSKFIKRAPFTSHRYHGSTTTKTKFLPTEARRFTLTDTMALAAASVVEEELTPAPRLIIILPAYNEAQRIEKTIIDYANYLYHSPRWSNTTMASTTKIPLAEILVVDDGSTDETISVVQSLAKSINEITTTTNKNDCHRHIKLRCVSLPQNKGKGAAITKGCLSCQNDTSVLVIADADGSGDIACLDGMVDDLSHLIMTRYGNVGRWDDPAIIVGRRRQRRRSSTTSLSNNIGEDEYEEDSPLRLLLRWGFRTCVKLICGDLGVRDTQCGFKVMTKTAGLELYPDLNLKRWTHDVELLFLAREKGIPVDEHDVGWVDMEGSKLVTSYGGVVGVSLQMLIEILNMRWQYFVGNWKVNIK